MARDSIAVDLTLWDSDRSLLFEAILQNGSLNGLGCF